MFFGNPIYTGKFYIIRSYISSHYNICKSTIFAAASLPSRSFLGLASIKPLFLLSFTIDFIVYLFYSLKHIICSTVQNTLDFGYSAHFETSLTILKSGAPSITVVSNKTCSCFFQPAPYSSCNAMQEVPYLAHITCFPLLRAVLICL